MTSPACQVKAGACIEYHAEVVGTLGLRPFPKRAAVTITVQSGTQEPFRRVIPVLVVPSWFLVLGWAVATVFTVLVWNRYTESVKDTGAPWAAVQKVIGDWRFVLDVGLLTLFVGFVAWVVGLGWMVGGAEGE